MTEIPRDASMDVPIHARQPESSGLKTVTVFVIVLLFHVVGIVGFLIWQYNHQGNPDANLTNSDRSHTDSSTPDSSTTTTPATATGDSTTAPAAPATATTPDNSTTPSASGDGSNVANSSSATPDNPVVMPATSSALARNTSTTSTAPVASTAMTVADNSTPNTPPSTPDSSAVTPAVTADSKEDTSTAPATTAPAATGENYVVKHGDTLAKIAKKHHVRMSDLRLANNLTTDSVKLGESLIIPAKVVKVKTPKPAAPTTTTHAVLASATTPAPTGMTPAPETTAAPMAPAPSATPAPTDAADSTPGPNKAYTVVHGDTMTRIAHKFHITTTALIAANPNIPDPAKLAIGDKLTVPAPTPRKKKKTPTPAAAQ